ELPGKRNYLTAIRKVRQMIDQEKPDLIHTVLARSDVVGRIAGHLSRRPVFSSLVNETYSAERQKRLGLLRRMKLKCVQSLDWFTSRWVTAFIANSEATRKSNCEALGLRTDKVSVVYRAREYAAFVSGDLSCIPKLREELKIANGEAVILSVG